MISNPPPLTQTAHALIRPLAILILIALSATNLYRAKTQSITCDEAYTYQLWGSRPWSHMFDPSDASNHVLQTLLSKASVAIFGLSEFALRLPTLLGGILYFIAVYRLSGFVFGQGGLFLLSVCVLCLNPLLLDLLSAARGYGLALAFCTWALFYMLKGPAETPSQLLRLALLLALSVSSNVAFLFIDAGLAALFVAALLRTSHGPREIGRAVLKAVAYFIIPGIALTLIVIGGPMRNTHQTDFYFGWPSLARSATSLVRISFIHRITLPGIRHYYPALDRFANFISAWFVPAILSLAGFAWLWSTARGLRDKTFLEQRQDRFLFFAAGALLFSVAASCAVHQGAGLLYPATRTGLHWIIFFLLTCLALVKTVRIIQCPVLAFLLMCALWFAFQFNVDRYTEWTYDAGTKRIVGMLRTEHQTEPDKNWQVGVTWVLLPSMNFYKSLYHLDWFQPVDTRNGTAGLTRFVLAEKETQLLVTQGLHATYIDPVSSQVLATKTGESK